MLGEIRTLVSRFSKKVSLQQRLEAIEGVLVPEEPPIEQLELPEFGGPEARSGCCF